MNATTEIIMKNKLYFPTLCIGVGRGHGCKTLEVNVKLATQICKDWDTMEEKRMYIFSASGYGMGHGGQCLDYFKDEAFQYIMPQEKQALFERIFEIWKEYHLNDLQAGTKWQTEMYEKLLKDAQENCPKLAEEFAKVSRYDMITKGTLSRQNIRENGYKPLMYDNARGDYKYGTSWLCKPIPTEIVEEILSWGSIKSEPREEIEAMRKALRKEYAKRRKEGVNHA